MFWMIDLIAIQKGKIFFSHQNERHFHNNTLLQTHTTVICMEVNFIHIKISWTENTNIDFKLTPKLKITMAHIDV